DSTEASHELLEMDYFWIHIGFDDWTRHCPGSNAAHPVGQIDRRSEEGRCESRRRATWQGEWTVYAAHAQSRTDGPFAKGWRVYSIRQQPWAQTHGIHDPDHVPAMDTRN